MPNSTTISFQQWLKDHNGDVSQLVFDWDWSLSASQYTRVPAPTYASTVAVVESTSFSAPLATDADKAQVLMNFRVLVKLTEDDWGSALLSYQNASQVVVDMTDVTHQAESGAEGGHLEWSMPGSVLISSGDNYELSATNKNIDYSDPYANVAICGYELEVYPLEPGGRKKPCDCGCSENNCQSGGMPSATARSSSSIDTTRSGAGIRTLGYGSYNELVTDSLIADGVTHLITELLDDYGRSVGYTYAKNGSVQQTVSTGYGADGRVTTAGVVHGGAVKQFNYAYLNGTHLLQTLTMPNNMSLTQSLEEKRDLLTQMDYKRGNTLVSQRVYTFDALGRPLTCQTSRNGQTINDSFVHTYRSELASAQVNGQTYAYDYDNIGNRRMAIDASDYAFYDANELNQCSSIRKNEETAFVPTFDTAGNQTLVKTASGVWTVTYNAENRPIIFQKTTNSVTTRITCTYDYMGRRATKKVEEITTDAEGNESITVVSNHRFIYRGYLQIACCDLTRANPPCLWLITWDPTQPVATRPLAIQKDGTWFCYGWDLTKNICEVFGKNGYIRSTYTYSPFGSVTTSGDVTQPIQWSSEYYDSELALVYYNYRYYNPTDGRWINRDPIAEQGGWNLYDFLGNDSSYKTDITGKSILYQGQAQEISEKGAKVESEFITKLRKKAKQYDTPWMIIAIGEIGNKENSIQGNKTPCVKKYIDSLPSETARNHMLQETNPPWCACFAYWVLTQNGEKISFDKDPYDYVRALRYSKCWCKISEPKFGALFIRGRSGGGHIGFVVGANKTHVWVLGGNQSNSVKITPYHKSTVKHYRFPCNKKSYEPILMTEKVQKESENESMI